MKTAAPLASRKAESPIRPEIAAPEPSRSSRYDSLDAWRGVACLAVLIFHVAGHDRRLTAHPAVVDVLTRFWLGVPMFFVVSGYCIAATCDIAAARGRSFGWYMRRRVRRIFPPYWICLASVVALSAIGLLGREIGDPASLTPSQWAGNVALIERWRLHLFGEDQSFVLGTAWTLCYEEQFYLVCGLILAASRRSFFIGTAAVTMLVVPMAVLNWSGVANLHGFFFDGHWLQFAAGVLVYYCRNHAGVRGGRAAIGILFGAAAGTLALRLALPLSLVNGYSRAFFLDGTAFAAAFAATLLLLGRWDRWIATGNLTRPLMACGLICYSLYLTHLPVISGVRRLVAWAGFGTSDGPAIGIVEAVATSSFAVVVGAGFYWLVERHFLNTPARRTPGVPTV